MGDILLLLELIERTRLEWNAHKGRLVRERLIVARYVACNHLGSFGFCTCNKQLYT